MLEHIVNRYGEKYMIDTTDYIGQCIKQSDRFSPTEIEFLQQFIQETDNVIELGANCGSHTIPLAKRNPNGKYFCFEPQEDIFDILTTNITLNGLTHVVPYKYAVGNKEEVIKYSTRKCCHGQNRGGFQIPQNDEHGYDATLTVAPITKFKELYELDTIRLVKLDIEGYEPIVLETMDSLIKKYQPILFVEYNRSTFSSITSIIKAHGYSIYYFNTLCSQYKQCIGQEDSSIKLCDVNLVCFPEQSTYTVPPFLTRVLDEQQPRMNVFVSYKDLNPDSS